jgi:lipoprotein-releasing system ATP-binding protein
MIRIANLHKTFIKDGQKINVLRGIDLAIPRGESLAIVGVSGAGKSTLLHILGLLDHPSEGEITYDGADISRWDGKRQAAFRNRKIGFVFQFHNLLPEFTGLENAMMPALIHGLSPAKARPRAEAILADVGLADRIHHKPGELSGGEQQRVAVARALIMEPDIILADEPTGNLDRETGKKIEDILIALNEKKGMTLVVVTHNPAMAIRMSRRVGLLDGRIAPHA